MSAFVMKAEGGTHVADRDVIRHALSLLISPGERHELRGLPGGRLEVASGDDLDEAVEAAYRLSDGQVYYSLNPIAVDAKRASKGTVTRRRWLLGDIDPVRPADVSSTDAEKDAAGDVACRVTDYLMDHGWPAPLMIDSGNGWHLLYAVDLPNDALSHQLCKAVLAHLGSIHDTDAAKVDPKTHDAARIAKLPGTLARKGVSTPERPHRMCRIAYEPDEIEIVPTDLIHALVQSGQPTNGHPGPSFATRATATDTDKSAYVRSAVEKECYRVALSPAGDRNNILNDAAFRLGTMAGWPEADEREIGEALRRSAERAGLGERETLLTIASGWTAGKAKPRERPADPATAKAPPAAGTPLIVWASSIKPKKVEWLWPRRIPLGKMTTFAGNGGLGKTFVLCDIAARVSTGAEWPYCGGECAERGKTLFISGEDDQDDTLVPRLMECGADLRNIAFLSPESEGDFSLAAVDLLTRILDQMRDVRLVAIDPPTSYLSGVDDHSNAELRGVLTPLKRWCADRRTAIIFNTHVNKSIGKDVEAASRVMGSVAWVNAVRAAHMFIRDEEDRDKVIFATIKTNNAKFPMALSYRITPTKDDQAKVEWVGESDQSADEVLDGKKKTRGASAVEWLTGLFGMQREWRSDDLRAMAKEVGVSKYALFESPEVKALPIDRKRRSNATGDAYWVWRAREGWPEKPIGILGESESCSVSPIKARNIQGPDRGNDDQDLGERRDLARGLQDPDARGQDPDILPRSRKGSEASGSCKYDPAKGLTEQDSDIPERADPARVRVPAGAREDPRFARPEGWKDAWVVFNGDKPKTEES